MRRGVEVEVNLAVTESVILALNVVHVVHGGRGRSLIGICLLCNQKETRDEVAAMDEFLGELETIEPVESLNKKDRDWPAPIISPSPKYSSFRVDLPTFIKHRQEKDNS